MAYDTDWLDGAYEERTDIGDDPSDGYGIESLDDEDAGTCPHCGEIECEGDGCVCPVCLNPECPGCGAD